MEDFRFEQLDIWKEANQVSDILFDYADKADNKKLYKKIGDYLIRKGYSYEISKRVLNRIFKEAYGGE